MRFGARILFDDATCTFLAGRRYAITGPNGAGKSTLMKILAGEIEPAKGSVTRPAKFGVLRQDQFAFDAFRAIDTVVMGNAPLWKAMEERDILYAKPHEELTDEDGMRLGELEGIVGEEGGYAAESDAAVLLDGLGVDVRRVFTLTFAGSAALAALAGLLLAPVFTVYPYMGAEMILLAFIVVILGGMGSMGGSVVAAFVIGITQSLLTLWLNPQRVAIAIFGIMIVVLIVRPRGFFGREGVLE